jgi:glutamyl-tRNA synthetase
LKWLGIVPENLNNILVQSKRKEIYLKHALDLVAAGKAYVCECSKDRLEELRNEQEKKKLPTQYDRHCREKNLEYLPDCVIRFKMSLKGKANFDDLILGETEFDLSLQDDPIILKSDGFPTYHLASVVDDHITKISHVIRGVEWLASTPKHLEIYKAFGWTPPKFAHLPVILGPDHKHKLSKRDGDVSVIDFKKKGYLPEALVNFLAFLGWNPKDEREIFSLEELVKEFKIKNINKAPAIFNIEKLNSLNSIYLKSENNKEKVKNYLEQFGVNNISAGELELIGRGGYKTLKEVSEYILTLRKEPEYKSALLVFKKSTKEKTIKGLEITNDKLQMTNKKDWSLQELQMQLGLIVERNDLTNGDVFWPVRVALSGEEKSPSPAELAIALGKNETLLRLKRAVKKLK